MTPRQLALAALVAALPLAGCGKMGNLERPGPLFGHANASAEPAGAQDPNRPVQTFDPRDRNAMTTDSMDPDGTTDLSPIRSRPIQGQGQNPTGTAPRGALPDPYANPQ